MDQSRNYIIERMKQKPVSISEFNYDNLKAPPISCMFSPQDISRLNQIATSLRLSGRPKDKYKMIDEIMTTRGFVKLASGTNRIVYRPLEDNSFVVKVAIDSVGIKDSPREYANQFIFKPFVTKVFEVTPCGTLGVFERVIPITSREEYLSVASDIYTMLNEWFIGEYVLEDIGTEFFMNTGIRKGFGPVIIDFPYVYKLDGNKLFCKGIDKTSPTGYCEGIIDYDAGFNHLYCTKCGTRYRAKELEEFIKDNKIIVKSKGERKMKIRTVGGTKKNVKVEENPVVKEDVKSMPSKPLNGRDEKMSNRKMKEEEKKAEKTIDKSEKKEVISPISFNESLKKKTLTIDDFDKKLEELLEIMDNVSKEDHKEISLKMTIALKDMFKGALDSAKSEFLDTIIEDESFLDKLSKDKVKKFIEILKDKFGYSDSDEIKDIKFFTGNITNIKDIFQDRQPGKILVLNDTNGDYLTIDGNIIAIDLIDEKSLDSLSIVSTQWLNNVLKELNSKESEDDSEEEVKEIPTGMMSPSMSVNGVPVNDEETE